MQLFILQVSDMVPYRIGLCFMAPIVLRFITRSSWPNSIGGSKWEKELSQIPVSKGFLKFQIESIIGAIKAKILLDDRVGWIHEGMMRS
jgi:hypothetical protein